jgi:hypothetical protein
VTASDFGYFYYCRYEKWTMAIMFLAQVLETISIVVINLVLSVRTLRL